MFWKTRTVNWAKWWPLDRLGWGLRCVWRPDPTFPWQGKEFNTSIKLLPAWLEFSFQHGVDHLIYTFRGTENAAMMLWESWSIIRLAIQDPFRSLSSRVTSSFWLFVKWLFVQRKTPCRQLLRILRSATRSCSNIMFIAQWFSLVRSLVSRFRFTPPPSRPWEQS